MIKYFPHIFYPNIYVGAAFCERDYLSELKRLGIKTDEKFVDKSASCKRLQKLDSSGTTFLICFDPLKNKKVHKNQIAALICHEAVHVSDWIFEEIGEDKVGMETRAYLVQYIVQQTLYELDNYLKKRDK